MESEYAHTPLERLNVAGQLVTVCAACAEPFPCQTQQVHARWASLELAAYFARYFPPPELASYAHAAAIAAAEAQDAAAELDAYWTERTRVAAWCLGEPAA